MTDFKISHPELDQPFKVKVEPLKPVSKAFITMYDSGYPTYVKNVFV